MKLCNEDQLLNFLRREEDSSVKYRLAFLNNLKNLSYDLDKACVLFAVAKSTAYVWIRMWNEHGYEGIVSPFHKSDRPSGRPPKLSDDDLKNKNHAFKKA